MHIAGQNGVETNDDPAVSAPHKFFRDSVPEKPAFLPNLIAVVVRSSYSSATAAEHVPSRCLL